MIPSKHSPKWRDVSDERYWGSFGGLSLLQRMRTLCGHVAGLHAAQNASEDDFVQSFDTIPPPQPSTGSWDAFALLPSKERLLACIQSTKDEACCLLSFLGPLDETVRHIYDTDAIEYTAEDKKSLALLFAIAALGRRFEVDETDNDPTRLSNNISKGYH